QPLLRRHLGLVAQPGTCEGEVRPALLRVVGAPPGEDDRRAGPGQRDDRLSELAHGHLVFGTAVDRSGLGRVEQQQDAAYQVVDVADGPGLGTGAVYRDRLAAQRLGDEGRHGPTVVRPHPGPVRVEDPYDPDVQPAGPVVRHGGRLGEPLRLVVHAAYPV